MTYVCIDESGDSGYSKKSSRYFIVSAVIVEDLAILRKIAKDTYRHVRSGNSRGILHAYSENNITKNRLTKKLLLSEISCIAVYFDKGKNYSGDIYLRLLEKLADYLKNREVQFIISRRDSRKIYNENIITMFEVYGIRAALSDPAREKALQIADFYAWVIFSKFEKENGEYFEKLKHLIKIIS